MRMFLCSSSSAVGLWLRRLVGKKHPWSACNQQDCAQSIRIKIIPLMQIMLLYMLSLNFVNQLKIFFFFLTHESQRKFIPFPFSSLKFLENLIHFYSNFLPSFHIDILTHSFQTFTTNNPGLWSELQVTRKT